MAGVDHQLLWQDDRVAGREVCSEQSCDSPGLHISFRRRALLSGNFFDLSQIELARSKIRDRVDLEELVRSRTPERRKITGRELLLHLFELFGIHSVQHDDTLAF